MISLGPLALALERLFAVFGIISRAALLAGMRNLD